MERCFPEIKKGAPFGLYFTEPELTVPNHRLQEISLQGEIVATNFNVSAEAGGVMKGTVRDFRNIQVKNDLVLELSASRGNTIISGLELIRYE